MQNRIGDRGCAALCAVLHETRIALLNLGSNLLGPRSLAFLADALSVNACLEALDLSSNKLCGVAFCGEVALTLTLTLTLAVTLTVTLTLTLTQTLTLTLTLTR